MELQDNHKRAISSTFRILEKSIDDMTLVLKNNIKENTYEVKTDLSAEQRKELLAKLNNLKNLIKEFVNRYSLSKEIIVQSRLFNNKKLFWEMYLEEISSKIINKKYGKMEIDTKIFDKDLLSIINYIKSI